MKAHEQLRLNYKFWIETESGSPILGEGKWKLLKAIEETGSLKDAAEKMGFAYRQTWENLKNIEERLGFRIIEKSRGGEKGGQTVLTEKGRQIVAFFDRLYQETEPELQKKFAGMINDLRMIQD